MGSRIGSGVGSLQANAENGLYIWTFVFLSELGACFEILFFGGVTQGQLKAAGAGVSTEGRLGELATLVGDTKVGLIGSLVCEKVGVIGSLPCEICWLFGCCWAS